MLDSIHDIKRALQEKAEHIHPPAELKRKVMKELELLNSKGQSAAKVTVDTLDTEDLMDQVLRQLLPGTGKAVYIVDNNPNKIISNQTNYEAEQWHGSLDALRKHAHPYLFKTPVDCELKEIFVMYGFDSLTANEMKEMYEEADRSGQRIIVRDLRKNQRLVGVKLIYDKDRQPFELHILTTTKSRIHVPDINRHHIERTRVGDHDGVYLSDSVNQQLLWVVDDNNRNLQYEIRTSNSEKEWLYAIAESLSYEK